MESRKSILIIILLMITTVTTVLGQYPMKKPKFGKIEESDMKMTVYDQDTTAAAVFLMDFGNTYLGQRDGISVMFERHMRIKILKKDGYDWADWEIPFYYRNSIDRIKGVVYNVENGEVVEHKLTKDMIFTEKSSKFIWTKKFKMPNVKEGSLIEITYTMESGNLGSLKEWDFQKSIPVRWSNYRITYPYEFDYKHIMSGGRGVTVRDKQSANTPFGNGFTHIFAMKDVPAIRPEPFMTTVDNYKSNIRFELASVTLPGYTRDFNNSWGKIAGGLYEDEDIGDQLKRGKFLREIAASVTSGLSTDKEKTIAIIDYVKENVKWDERETFFTTQTLKKTLEEHEGTSGDINILLTVMLKQAGISADPVILSSRENGIINRFYPNAGMFSYLVSAVKLESGLVLVDGTDPLRPWNELPFKCLNGEGIMLNIDEKRFDWVTLMNQEKFARTTSVELHLEDDQFVGKVTDSFTGLSGYNKRKEIDDKGNEDYRKNLMSEYASISIENLILEDFDNLNNSMKQKFDVVLENAQVAGNMIYFNPMIVNVQEDNPFNTDKRKFPIDFGCPIARTTYVNIQVPQGYTVDEMPESVNIALPEGGGSYQFIVMQQGDKITVMSKLKIDKSLFVPEYSNYLKEFYSLVVSKQNEQFVLRKQS